MCTLGYSSHVPKWHGKNAPHSHRSVFPSQLIFQDRGSVVANRSPLQRVGWADVTWPFPSSPLVNCTEPGCGVRVLPWKEGEKTFTPSHHFLEWVCITFGVQKSDVGQAMFWRVNMSLMPNDSVFCLDVCSRGSVKKGWCAVSTIYKMNK